MTKVTMPEPVAIAYETKDGGVIFTATTYGAITLKRGDSVIATTQAEAYADARVREASTEVAEMCDNVFSFSVGDSVRDLMYKMLSENNITNKY